MKREVNVSSSTNNSNALERALDLRARKSGFKSCSQHIKYFHFKMDIIELLKENRENISRMLPNLALHALEKKNQEAKSMQN